MNKISIIIPNFNSGKYIKKTMNSIVNQTYENFEVIFIDDGSTDDSLSIIEEYKNILKKKLTIISQFNQNGAIARNRGLEIATGDYVLFLDSDDELYSDSILEKMIMEIKGYDLLLGNYILIDEKSKKIGEYINENRYLKYDNQFKYVDISPVPSSKLYKMDIIRKNNIYTSNVKIGQDLNFYLKYLSCSDKIKITDLFLYKYRILQTSISRVKNTNFIDIYNSVNEIRKFYIKNNKEEIFYKYVAPTCIGNISGQMEKIKNFKNIKIRRMVFSYIEYAVNDFIINNKFKTKEFNNKVFKYKIKKVLLRLKLFK